LKSLDSRRKALESEAAATVDELMTPPEDGGEPMGVDTPLTDGAGHPRNDIDIYRARILRKRLNEIRTDHKGLMRQIETGLVKMAALSKSSDVDDSSERDARLVPKPKPKFDPTTGKWVVKNWDGSVAGVEGGEMRNFNNLESQPAAPPHNSADTSEDGASDPDESEEPVQDDSPLLPFAVIDAVAPRSPSSAAGLREGDLVVKFGKATHVNHSDLRLIAELVPEAASNREEIPIIVLRRSAVGHGAEEGIRERITVNVLPGPWGGRGLLGCHIKGYSDKADNDKPS